ncbi:hypothetical protein FOFC_21332 [Fusarium oxysporum]|nr:hypothetical protein FOFC_21332 [Fusarium oxysporum]
MQVLLTRFRNFHLGLHPIIPKWNHPSVTQIREMRNLSGTDLLSATATLPGTCSLTRKIRQSPISIITLSGTLCLCYGGHKRQTHMREHLHLVHGRQPHRCGAKYYGCLAGRRGRAGTNRLPDAIQGVEQQAFLPDPGADSVEDTTAWDS